MGILGGPEYPGRRNILPGRRAPGKPTLGPQQPLPKTRGPFPFRETALRLLSGLDAAGMTAALSVFRNEFYGTFLQIITHSIGLRGRDLCKDLQFIELGFGFKKCFPGPSLRDRAYASDDWFLAGTWLRRNS